MAVPCSLFGKKTLVEGMKDEKSPPPKPQRNDIIRKCKNGVSRFCTANPNHTMGMSFIKVAIVSTRLVPNKGIRNACTVRMAPPERPGMAAIQNNCIVSNLNPMLGRRTTTALMTNHVANEKNRPNVVTPSVPHARPLPSDFQNSGFSGSHLFNQDDIYSPLQAYF
jgi:hypothetical protein